MERDYRSELRALTEQLKRLADATEEMNQRSKASEPLAREALELSLDLQRKVKQKL